MAYVEIDGFDKLLTFKEQYNEVEPKIRDAVMNRAVITVKDDSGTYYLNLGNATLVAVHPGSATRTEGLIPCILSSLDVDYPDDY